eukprot:PhF_6_TR790/c0_g1_i1/m.1210
MLHNVPRAVILVSEARRQEALHLEHQRQYFEALSSMHSSPNKIRRTCACCALPLHRTLDYQGRVENIFFQHFPREHAKALTSQLLKKYEHREAQLVDELVSQYGAEPTEDTADHKLESVMRRQKNLNNKWRAIMMAAKNSASKEDYANVIRHLSVMRIFLEGSQALTYSCDPMERERRDMVHMTTLQKLGLNPCC